MRSKVKDSFVLLSISFLIKKIKVFKYPNGFYCTKLTLYTNFRIKFYDQTTKFQSITHAKIIYFTSIDEVCCNHFDSAWSNFFVLYDNKWVPGFFLRTIYSKYNISTTFTIYILVVFHPIMVSDNFCFVVCYKEYKTLL